MPFAAKLLLTALFWSHFRSSFISMHSVKVYLGLAVVVLFGPMIIVTAVPEFY